MKRAETHESTEDKAAGREHEIGIFESLWKLFSSMRTAIVLLLILAAVSIIGTVIAQNALPQEYTRIYGPTKYVVFKSLGLTDVYHSGWYRFLLLLIGVNLFVCSVNRFKIIRERAYRPNVSIKLWGPYLTHVSILVIFIGAVIGNLLGFEGFTTITEGKSTNSYYRQSAHEETNLGFRVALDKFLIEHDDKHYPIAYKSDLKVYEKDKLVAQKVIDVNHPLTYKGVSFFQSDYGLTGFVLKITGPDGDSVRVPFDIETGNGEYGKEYMVSGDPFNQVEIGGKKLTVFVHNFAPDYTSDHQTNLSSLPINPAANIMINDRFPEYKGLDAWSNLGWLEISKSAKYKGFTITLDDVVDYTGLQVSRNPGLPIVYIGFGLLLVGLFLSFYINPKE